MSDVQPEGASSEVTGGVPSTKMVKVSAPSFPATSVLEDFMEYSPSLLIIMDEVSVSQPPH